MTCLTGHWARVNVIFCTPVTMASYGVQNDTEVYTDNKMVFFKKEILSDFVNNENLCMKKGMRVQSL